VGARAGHGVLAGFGGRGVADAMRCGAESYSGSAGS
jgi:hypothetical protein